MQSIKSFIFIIVIIVISSCGNDDVLESPDKILLLYVNTHVNYNYVDYYVVDPKCESNARPLECIENTLKTYHNKVRFKLCQIESSIVPQISGTISIEEFISRNCENSTLK